MKVIVSSNSPGSSLRRAIINIASVATMLAVIFTDSPCRFALTKSFNDLAMLLFSVIGIYAFYSGLFRFYDWYNDSK